MINCFIYYGDGNRRKLIELKNHEIWMISVPSAIWNKNLSKKVSYWISQKNKGNHNYTLKYCIVQEITDDVADILTYCCCCKKNLGSRASLVKHAKKCKPSDELVLMEPETHVTNIRIPHDTRDTISKEKPKLRNYGKENPRWFTKNLMYYVMGDIDNAIPKLVEFKHFNDNFPENKNLRLESRRTINKRLRVFENGRWKTRKTKQTFYQVIIDIYDILCEALEKDEDDSDSEGEVIDGDVPEEDHVDNEIRKLHQMEKFATKLNKIRPIWERFRTKMSNQELRIDMWEDLKTFLLDRQLAIEQGFD